MSIAIVIPARLGSRRIEAEPLATLGGLELIEHVRRRALAVRGVESVVVATDDERVAQVVERAGGRVIVTGPAASGTHRVALAAAKIPADFYVNVQGDMPLLDPAHVETVCSMLRGGSSVATLAAPLDAERASNPAIVKVVRSRSGRAIYFSRLPIPYQGPWYSHVGIYGFSSSALVRCTTSGDSTLEASENLEQLRWLDAGVPIDVGLVERGALAIDTPEQLRAAKMMFREAHLESTPSPSSE